MENHHNTHYEEDHIDDEHEHNQHMVHHQTVHTSNTQLFLIAVIGVVLLIAAVFYFSHNFSNVTLFQSK